MSNEEFVINDDSIILNNFEISDSDIVTFFKNFNEPEKRKQKFLEMLKIGINVNKSMNTFENINYVDKAFENLQNDFEQKMNKIFAEDGILSAHMENHFGEDGKMMKEFFNLNKMDSPLSVLKEHLTKEIIDLRQSLGIKEAVKIVEEKGTMKGLVFEDACKTKLESIARLNGDKFEETGKVIGSVTNSKNGDFVLTLHDNSKKIVFEMKNMSTKLPPKYIYEQLKEAIENREADYGILVVKNKSSLPDHVGFFNEYDGNHLVCAIEDDDGIQLLEYEILHIAYKWASAKLRLENQKSSKIDSGKIKADMKEIQIQIGELIKVKRECTNIEKSNTRINEIATKIEKEIVKKIKEISNTIE